MAKPLDGRDVDELAAFRDWLRTIATFNPLYHAVLAIRALFNAEFSSPDVITGIVTTGVFAFLDRFDAELNHLRGDFFSRRKYVFRQAVSRFHDQRLSVTPFRALGREARAQFEVARVEERAGFVFDQQLR